MSVYRIIGDEVVPDRVARQRPTGALIASDEEPGAVGQFHPIGLGQPLTIEIRHVYTGRFPKAGLFGGSKDVALVSGIKDYSVFAASARALNLISRDVTPRASLRGSAFDDGTPIILYSPAVMADSLTLSIEFAIDAFPGEFVQQVSRSLKALAGVPLMLPHAGILLGAGEIVRLAGGLGDALFDGRPSFSITESIDFDRPGARIAMADFMILSHDPMLAGYRFRDGAGIVDGAGKLYEGDEPYVVISLDGKPRANLENFSATIASSAILERFFSVKDGAAASIDTLVEGVKLASDMRFRTQADALKRQIDALPPGAARDSLTKQREAALKNIVRDELRPARPPAADDDSAASTPAISPADLDMPDDTHQGGGAQKKATIRVPSATSDFGKNVQVTVVERDGQDIFEGDIALPKPKPGAKSYGIAIVGQQYRWPGAVMIWEADPEALDLAQAAMAHWSEKTGIGFKRRTTEEDYVHFRRLGSSWSYVGRQGGMQELSLGPTCTVGSAVHEIGHALGLWHEQSRGDRDQHVVVRLDRVDPENQHNFDKHIEDGVDIGAYDYGSIMHYSAGAFSTTGEPTILTKSGESIGQRTGLSAGDIAAVAAIYPETAGRA